RAVLAADLVVEINADHGIAAELASLLGHFLDRLVPGAGEDLLVLSGTAADEIGDRGENVAEQVRAGDHLAGDDAEIIPHRPTLGHGGGGDDHPAARAAPWTTH